MSLWDSIVASTGVAEVAAAKQVLSNVCHRRNVSFDNVAHATGSNILHATGSNLLRRRSPDAVHRGVTSGGMRRAYATS